MCFLLSTYKIRQVDVELDTKFRVNDGLKVVNRVLKKLKKVTANSNVQNNFNHHLKKNLNNLDFKNALNQI